MKSENVVGLVIRSALIAPVTGLDEEPWSECSATAAGTASLMIDTPPGRGASVADVSTVTLVVGDRSINATGPQRGEEGAVFGAAMTSRPPGW